ncbi:MAG: 3TM-type holin [Minisyncoccia bacterium]
MALDPVTAVSDLANTVINKIWPDKTEQEKAELLAAVSLVQGQLEVNKAEASSNSMFVAGWRPYIGWICGSALGYTYLLYPILTWVTTVWFPSITPPVLGNDGMLYELLFGMLGMGALRTFEKVKGVAR